MKIDSSCCRLCFTQADEPIDIFGDAVTEFNIVDVLAQYFLDQVAQDDALPKVVCHDCWSQIETFHSFVQRVIAIRDDYLRQPLSDCVKEEDVSGEFSVSMDETEIHQENVCVEPVSLTSGDPLAVEVGLMETKFQIDMETEENGAVLSNDEECDHSHEIFQPNDGSLQCDKSIIDEQNEDTSIADYFDMTCDLCPVVFTALDDAILKISLLERASH